MATIYAIECKTTQFVYVGCTKGKIGKRMREHRCLLNLGAHTAIKMAEDWRKYGSGDFTIFALEQTPDDLLETRRAYELRWLQYFDGKNRLYNAHIVSFRPTDECIRLGILVPKPAGNRWTPEANEKRRMAQLGIPKGHGAKISATKQARKAAR